MLGQGCLRAVFREQLPPPPRTSDPFQGIDKTNFNPLKGGGRCSLKRALRKPWCEQILLRWHLLSTMLCLHPGSWHSHFWRRKPTVFHADFRKKFPSRTLCRGPSWNCPSPSCALCPSLYRTEHFSREEKGEKAPRKSEEEGGQQRGQKGKKDAWKQVRKCSGRKKCALHWKDMWPTPRFCNAGFWRPRVSELHTYPFAPLPASRSSPLVPHLRGSVWVGLCLFGAHTRWQGARRCVL